MKRLLMVGICLSLMMGCQTTSFDPAIAARIATITGESTALVVLTIPSIATNQQIKAAIYQVTKTIETVVPATNQTFAAAATPVIVQAVDKLVSEGKLNPIYAALTKDGSILAVDGLDLVMAKFPKIKESTTDVNIIVKAYTAAFNKIFMPIGLAASSGPSKEVLDTVKELKEKNNFILKKLIK